MSGINLHALGLQPDAGDQPAAPAAPVAPEAAPAAPAAPQSVTGLVAQPAAPAALVAAPAAPAALPAVEPDEEIVVPEGADNPDAVRNAIAQERAAARAAYKRAREAEEKLAAITEAAMPVEERIAAVTQRATAAELRATKLAIGMDLGLPKTFAEMLQGSNEAELQTHGQAVLAELGQRKPAPTVPGVTLNGGHHAPPPAPSDPVQAHNQFLGRMLGRVPGA